MSKSENGPMPVEEASGLRKVKPVYLIVGAVALVGLLAAGALMLPGLLSGSKSGSGSAVVATARGAHTPPSASPSAAPPAPTGSLTKDPFKPLVQQAITSGSSGGAGASTATSGSTTGSSGSSSTGSSASTGSSGTTSGSSGSSGTASSTTGSTGGSTGSTGSTGSVGSGSVGSSGGTATAGKDHFVLLDVYQTETTKNAAVRVKVGGTVYSVVAGGTFDSSKYTFVSATFRQVTTSNTQVTATFKDSKGTFTIYQGQDFYR